MKYSCKLPVGAWGYWGHRHKEYYYILCNRALSELREIHFSCISSLGFQIGDICGNYQEFEVSKEISDKLEAVGISVPIEPGPDEIFELWMSIFKYIDPDFHYEIIDPPDIAFIGLDEKGRSFDAPGYGVFD